MGILTEKKNLGRLFTTAACVLATLAMFTARGARAQGSRKDDIVFNAQGRPMAGATVRVCTSSATGQPCSPLAQIFSDPAMTQALANPTSTDGLGNYSFYAAPGRYEIEIGGPGITTKQIPNVILPSDPSSPTFTSLTTTSGINAFSLTLSGGLTVNGSAVVSGSLTVGGAPVPSTSQDNQWTNSQRFKGPVPHRDITAFGACSSSYYPVTHVTGTINSGTNTLTLSSAFDFANNCGILVAGAGAASTIVAPTGCSVVPQGPLGSTTVVYQAAVMDGVGGESPVSASFQTTQSQAYASLTKDQWNFIFCTGIPASTTHLVIYSDKGTGGALTKIGAIPVPKVSAGQAAGGAYDDFGSAYIGVAFPSLVNDIAPTAPPVANTNDWLATTITAGGGTTTLTLAASASHSVTSVWTQHDEDAALLSAINTACTNASTNHTEDSHVLIPAGVFYFANPVLPSCSSGITLHVDGDMAFYLYPFIIPWNVGYYDIEGQSIAYSVSAGQFFPTTAMSIGPNVPAAVYVGTNLQFTMRHMGASGLVGNGIMLAPLSSGDGIQFDAFAEATPGAGSPFVVDVNVIGVYADSLNLTGTQQANGLPSLYFNGVSDQRSSVDLFFSNVSMNYHSVKMDQPIGGSGGGGVWQHVHFGGNWLLESIYDRAFLEFDGGNKGGPNSPMGGLPGINLQGLYFERMDMSDTIGLHYLLYYTNPNPVAGVNGVLSLQGVTGFGPGVLGGLAGSTWTNRSFSNSFFVDESNETTPQGSIGLDCYTRAGGQGMESCGVANSYLALESPSSGGNDTSAFTQAIPSPFISSTSTGAGSLSAGTYSLCVAAEDMQATPGVTLCSPEQQVTVGASSSITVNFAEGGGFNGGAGKFRLYFGTTGYGNENQYTTTTNTASITLTSNSGTAGVPPSGNTTRASKFPWDSNKDGWFGAGFNGMPNQCWGFGSPPTTAAKAAGCKIDVEGNAAYLNGGAIVGGGTKISAIYKASGALTYSSIAAQTCQEQTMTVTGAATSGVASASPASSLGSANLSWSAWVSSSNAVSVRVCNVSSGSITPSSVTWNVNVVQ